MKRFKFFIGITLLPVLALAIPGSAVEMVNTSGSYVGGMIAVHRDGYIPPVGEIANRFVCVITNPNRPRLDVDVRLRIWQQNWLPNCPSGAPLPPTAVCVGTDTSQSPLYDWEISLPGSQSIHYNFSEIVQGMGVNEAMFMMRIDWWVNQTPTNNTERRILPIPVTVLCSNRTFDSNGNIISQETILPEPF